MLPYSSRIKDGSAGSQSVNQYLWSARIESRESENTLGKQPITAERAWRDSGRGKVPTGKEPHADPHSGGQPSALTHWRENTDGDTDRDSLPREKDWHKNLFGMQNNSIRYIPFIFNHSFSPSNHWSNQKWEKPTLYSLSLFFKLAPLSSSVC